MTHSYYSYLLFGLHAVGRVSSRDPGMTVSVAGAWELYMAQPTLRFVSHVSARSDSWHILLTALLNFDPRYSFSTATTASFEHFGSSRGGI